MVNGRAVYTQNEWLEYDESRVFSSRISPVLSLISVLIAVTWRSTRFYDERACIRNGYYSDAKSYN